MAKKLVITKSRREDFTIGRNPGGKIHRLRQTHGVTEVLCRSAMAGERGTNTKTICMVTIEITTFGQERVGMSYEKLVRVVYERDLVGVITVERTVPHTDKQKVGVEAKSQPELFLGVGRWKSSTQRVRK